jgi:hypothetical protein
VWGVPDRPDLQDWVDHLDDLGIAQRDGPAKTGAVGAVGAVGGQGVEVALDSVGTVEDHQPADAGFDLRGAAAAGSSRRASQVHPRPGTVPATPRMTPDGVGEVA